MSNTKQVIKKNNRNLFVTVGILAAVMIVFLGIKAMSGGGESVTSAGSDLIIPKSEITETAKFYPYKAGKTAMEVIAVKASDGTIRTALNTCQVCNGSPKAYYEQDGDVLVCQNCGNRFAMDQIEVEKGGCNPVPIMKENKTDDGANIIIPKAFLESNKNLFATWKNQ